ncbi:unnamed protein product [Owenia fusiformis]|uniref:BTB domain-containing protein n=1 Tax=Owenia fusiformis TaxID=6347 RepID=A0A8S4N741_OWEFU|nr:unnamed protein product [Owenia fusiformis]
MSFHDFLDDFFSSNADTKKVTMETPESPMTSSAGSEVLRDENNFIQNVSQFFNTQALSDVTLKIADQRYYAHKFVLAKSSDVFRTMLYERPWAQSLDDDEVELNESIECQSVFDKFLRYLYTAEVSINSQTCVGILCLADKYNVGSLKELCQAYMVENTKSPKIKNALLWYSWGKALHLEPLIERCSETIAWNAHEIITSPHWLNMDLDFVADMLQKSELVVPNEWVVLEATTRWLLHESHVGNLLENSENLLPYVRLPQMSIAQLYRLENSELSEHLESSSLIKDLLGKAFRFRALCPSQHALGVSFNEPFYQPRDYMDLTVDNVRMQNTLRFGIQVDVKMFTGPVPGEIRDADWKLTYRKNGEIWSLQIYAHETAMVNNEARFETSVVIFDELDKVIQVERQPVTSVTRGNSQNIQVTIKSPETSKNMAVLLKTVAS